MLVASGAGLLIVILAVLGGALLMGVLPGGGRDGQAAYADAESGDPDPAENDRPGRCSTEAVLTRLMYKKNTSPERYPQIHFLMNHLGNMEDALAPTLAGESVQANLEIGEAEVIGLTGVSQLVVYDGPEVAGTGTSTASLNPSAGSVDLVIEVTEDAVTRTLEQTVSVTDGVIHFCGTLTSSDGSPTLSGGWTYSPEDGPQEDPVSDPGFHDAVWDMLHIQPGEDRRWGFGTLLSFIGNIVTMVVNYVFDALVPYTPAVSCSGPLIYDGSGQSCEGVDIPCAEKLSEMCLEVENLPDVSNAFKQCMKGRCGCGGSSHRRLRISCADENNCGPCSSYEGSGGCNIGGSRMWYCDDTPFVCECIKDIFHEMSHSCGKMHSPEYWEAGACVDGDEPCRIGDWFEEQCTPVAGYSGHLEGDGGAS